jgi:hypothetical protein
MIQCTECEFFETDANGRKILKCDPCVDIKEPECLAKLQLFRLDMLIAGYQSMLASQRKLAPVQDKLLKYVQRELNDMDEAESWKVDEDEDDGDKPGPL